MAKRKHQSRRLQSRLANPSLPVIPPFSVFTVFVCLIGMFLGAQYIPNSRVSVFGRFGSLGYMTPVFEFHLHTNKNTG